MPFFSVVYFSRGTLPKKKGKRAPLGELVYIYIYLPEDWLLGAAKGDSGPVKLQEMGAELRDRGEGRGDARLRRFLRMEAFFTQFPAGACQEVGSLAVQSVLSPNSSSPKTVNDTVARRFAVDKHVH